MATIRLVGPQVAPVFEAFGPPGGAQPQPDNAGSVVDPGGGVVALGFGNRAI